MATARGITGLSGTQLTLAAAGALAVYVGIKGGSPVEELRNLLRGQSPAPLATTSSAKPFAGPSADTVSSQSTSSNGVVAAAQKYLGRPYKWAGNFENGGGGDCSGLVYRALNDAGISSPRKTSWGYRAWNQVRVVKDPAPGDLVWWPGHIGIMVSKTTMINSPHTGAVVRYAEVGPRFGIPPTYLRLITGAGYRSPLRGPL